MTFEDTIEIKAKGYGGGYVIIGNKAYIVADGVITSEEAEVSLADAEFDEDMNPRQMQWEYYPFSKCFISFNSSAQKIRLNDGQEYVYSYYVILPLKRSIYHLIPKEGEKVHITKADGTIDKEMEVRGFVTYKKRYLKLWL